MSVKNRLLKAGMTPDMAHFVSVPHSHNLNWDVTLSYWASRDCRDWIGDRCPCGTLPLKILIGIKPKRIPLEVKVMSYELAVTRRIQYSGKKRPCCRLKNLSVLVLKLTSGLGQAMLCCLNAIKRRIYATIKTEVLWIYAKPSMFLHFFFHLTASIPKHLEVYHSMKEKGHVTVTRNTQHYQQHVPDAHTEFISIPADQKDTNITHIIKLTPKHTALTVMVNTLFWQC